MANYDGEARAALATDDEIDAAAAAGVWTVTRAHPRPSDPSATDVPALRPGWRQGAAAVIDDVIGDNQHAG